MKDRGIPAENEALMSEGRGRDMITFAREGRRFTLRVAAVAVDGDRVLLHRFENGDFWCLPGGRVELQETAEQALTREIWEELDASVEIERLLWVVENFFQEPDVLHHEVGLYFLIRLPDRFLPERNETFEGSEGSQALFFRWFPVGSLATERVYPAFLTEGLKELPASTQHVVHVDTQV